MECLHVGEQLQVRLLGERQEVAQVVLMPGQTLLTFSDVLLYCSPSLHLTKSRAWRTSRPLISLSSPSLQYLGLSHPFTSPILALSPSLSHDELVVFQPALLCVYQLLPKPSLLPNYISLQGEGTVLIQRTSTIIEKSLGQGETFIVKSNCLVAFTGSTKVENTPKSMEFPWPLRPKKWRTVLCTGPGTVYISGEDREESGVVLTSADIKAIASLVIVMLCLVWVERVIGGSGDTF